MSARIVTYFNVYWSALREGYEPGDPLGHGVTEALAVADLREREAEKSHAVR